MCIMKWLVLNFKISKKWFHVKSDFWNFHNLSWQHWFDDSEVCLHLMEQFPLLETAKFVTFGRAELRLFTKKYIIWSFTRGLISALQGGIWQKIFPHLCKKYLEMFCKITFLREIAYHCKFIVFTEFIAKNWRNVKN